MNPAPLSIFIPAYNAAATLPEVIRRIPPELWPQLHAVTVIDDGSGDGTSATVMGLQAAYPKLALRRFASNQGYGAAVKRGLEICRASGSGFAACLHADGQYPPEQLPGFLEHMRKHGVDVLQGSRHLQGTARAGGMPWYKIAAGRLLTWMENRSFGMKLTDYHSGFLMYSAKALQSIPFAGLSGYFDFDLEVIACARARGLRIAELGIPTRYADEKSYLNPVKYGFRTVRVMARYRMGKYAPV